MDGQEVVGRLNARALLEVPLGQSGEPTGHLRLRARRIPKQALRDEDLAGSAAGHIGAQRLSLELNQRGMQALCRKAMQQEPVSRLQRGHWNERVLVVHEADIRRIT